MKTVALSPAKLRSVSSIGVWACRLGFPLWAIALLAALLASLAVPGEEFTFKGNYAEAMAKLSSLHIQFAPTSRTPTVLVQYGLQFFALFFAQRIFSIYRRGALFSSKGAESFRSLE